MSVIQSTVQTKHRTTFYLTEENKKMLDEIPRGEKTILVNQALSTLLKKMKKEKNNKKFVQMIQNIEPVETEHTSEEMVRALRENRQS